MHAKRSAARPGQAEIAESNHQEVKDEYWIPRGDGVSADLACWMEACVARSTITNAGEFNGFLKPKTRLFADPLEFTGGQVVLRADFRPRIDEDVLARHTIAEERFGA